MHKQTDSGFLLMCQIANDYAETLQAILRACNNQQIAGGHGNHFSFAGQIATLATDALERGRVAVDEHAAF